MNYPPQYCDYWVKLQAATSQTNTGAQMCSRYATKSPLSPLSPRSVNSFAEALPDPNEIARLLDNKGDHTPIYNAPSRESTPSVVVGTEELIVGIEGLQKSISSLSTTFIHEKWRQNIVDEGYWRIEADYWESCYDNRFNERCQLGQGWWEGDVLGAQHNLRFFEQAGQLDWLSIYTRLKSKTSAISPDEIPKLVFDTTYHHHRAKYWQDLCEKRGYTQSRKGIGAVEYWRKEFGYLFDESVRLEKEPPKRKRKPAQRQSVAGTRNTNPSLSAEAKKTGRSLAGGRKAPNISSMPTGIHKHYNLRPRKVMGR